MRDDHIVEVYWARNLQIAHTVRGLLESAGIEARVVGETLQGAIGELPAGPESSPRVWVKREDEERAKKICDEFDAKSASGEAWVCDNCGSDVDSGFDICWNCQATRS